MKTKKNILYSLHADDMCNVGGPMHSASSKEMWVKYFTTIEFAKEYAEKDYGKKIKWVKGKSDGYYLWSSGDLLHISYDIIKVKVEK